MISIYTTLAVRLAQSETFTHKELWKNAVTYQPTKGAGACGFFLTEPEEARGRLTIFHAEATPALTRELFEGFVEEHLRTHALPESIQSRRIVVCAECGTPVSDIVLERVLQRGRDAIECQVCGATISLKPPAADAVPAKTAEKVREMGRRADENRGKAEATAILEGKRKTNDFDVFLNYRRAERAAVQEIYEALTARGILPWMDVHEIKPGERWQQALQKQIKSIRSVAVCLGNVPLDRWQLMELEGFVAEFVNRASPVIPVVLRLAEKDPEAQSFLSGFHAVDFRKTEPDPMEQLIWGITGERRSKGERPMP